ncbi:unnamed protein product [Ectocarpus fasciculatus]
MSNECLNSRDEDEEYFSASDGRDDDISPSQPGNETSLAQDGHYPGEQTCGAAVRTDAAVADDSNECVKTDARHHLPPFVNAARRTAGEAAHGAASEPGHDDLAAATDPTMETRPPPVGNSSSSKYGNTTEPGGLNEPITERQEAATNKEPEGFSEVGRGCIETDSEANGTLIVESSRTENTAGTAANKVDQDHAVAAFGAFSVSCLKLAVAEDLEPAERPILIRLSDQHGNHRETTPRTCPNANPLVPNDGRATAWCEELQASAWMPILPDVDAILFELLLVSKPPYANDGCGNNPEKTDTTGSSGSVPMCRERLGPANPADYHRERTGATERGCKTPRSGGAEVGGAVSVHLKDGPNRESQPRALVGAVALLLSEVVGAWRTMESPLFDMAGGVAGRIRMAARIVGRPNAGPGGPLECERRRSRGDTKGGEPPSALEDDDCTPTRLPAAEVAGRDGPCGRRRESDFSPTAPCCGRQQGRGSGGRSSRGGLPPFSRSEEPAEAAAERGDLPRGAPAAVKVGCCSTVEADEMVPRAVILYRGMKLPFRWLRSGTARLMDKALREMLGINDTSSASPALYDVDTGEHVRLDPCNASGRTLLAVSEGISSSSPQHARSSQSSRRIGGGENAAGLSTPKNASTHTRGREKERLCHHYRCRRRRRDTATGLGNDDGQGRRPKLSLPKTNVCPSGAPSAIQRSASDGSLRRFTLAAVVTTTTGDGNVARPGTSLGCECLGGKSVTGESDVALWRKDTFAREVAEQHQRLHREREERKAEEEEQRRRETEHAHAKAVVCRLAYRVLCRARRTRVLALALWRWRLQASRLKLQQDMEDKQGREHKQAIAVLEGLREEVASLTATAYEGLVAVSIDALERELNDGDAADHQGMASQSDGNTTTPGSQDKEDIDRTVIALKTDIARLSRLRAERSRCLEERLAEIHAIKDAAAASDGPPTPTVAAASTAHIKRAADSGLPADTPAGGAGAGNDGDLSTSPSDAAPGEHRGTGMGNAEQNSSFPSADQLGRGGGAVQHSEGDSSEYAPREGAGDERLSFDTPSPSSPATTKSADIKGSGIRGSRQEAAAANTRVDDVWESVRNKDDAILENFLARHTQGAFELLGGKARLDHARASGVCESEEGPRGTRWGDADTGWGSSLLWVLFRYFSDCPVPPPISPQQWSNPVTAGSVSRETAKTSDFSDVRGSPREPSASSIKPPVGCEGVPERIMSLTAFLGVCRSAGLILPAGGGVGGIVGEGRASRRGGESPGQGHRQGGGGRVSEGGSSSRGRTLFRSSPSAIDKDYSPIIPSRGFTRTPSCRPQRLDPSEAARVFTRTMRNLGSVGSGAHHHTATCNDHERDKIAQYCVHRRAKSPRDGRRKAARGEDLRSRGDAKASPARRHLQRTRHIKRVRHFEEKQQPSESARSRRNRQCLPPEGLNFRQFQTALEGVLELLTVGSGERGFGCGGGGSEDDSDKNSVGFGGIGEGGEGDIGRVVGGGNAVRQRMVAMAPRLAMASVVQLAKELATKELLNRDSHARETLALLDPSLQYILDVNEQILHEIFVHYCRRYALSPILPRGKNTAGFPGRAMGGSDPGCVGRGGSGGGRSRSDMAPRGTALGLRFAGGMAFAEEFGLTAALANAQQLADLWEVSYSRQRNEHHHGAVKEPETASENIAKAEQEDMVGTSPRQLKILSFPGFLDFLGRFALRYSHTAESRDAKQGRPEATFLVRGVRLHSPSSAHHAGGCGYVGAFGGYETARVTTFGEADGIDHENGHHVEQGTHSGRSPDNSSPDLSAAEAMWALLALMNASGACHNVVPKSGAGGRAGGGRKGERCTGFRFPSRGFV